MSFGRVAICEFHLAYSGFWLYPSLYWHVGKMVKVVLGNGSGPKYLRRPNPQANECPAVRGRDRYFDGLSTAPALGTDRLEISSS